MGSSMTREQADRAKTRVYAKELLEHPSFDFPDIPNVNILASTFDTIVEWALECTARFISPNPKEDGEDEEFSCDDLVLTIRTELTQMLKSTGNRK